MINSNVLLHGDIDGTAERAKIATNAERFCGQTMPEFLANISCSHDFYVDYRSKELYPDGSKEHPCKSIQDALGLAPIAGDCITIHIAPGTYDEVLSFSARSGKWIILQGEGEGVRVRACYTRDTHLFIKNITFFGSIEDNLQRTIDALNCCLMIQDCTFEGKEASNIGLILHIGNAYIFNTKFKSYNCAVSSTYGSIVQLNKITFEDMGSYVVSADGGIICSDTDIDNKVCVRGGIVLYPELVDKINAL